MKGPTPCPIAQPSQIVAAALEQRADIEPPRLVALDVFVSSSHRPDSQHMVLDTESSATAIALRLGVSARSVSDALHALTSVGVITWQKECHPDSASNRFGESIPIHRASRERGDFIQWQHTSIVSMPVNVVIPEVLPESANVARARRRSVSERQRVAQMQDELQALLRERECPSCGAHGALQATVSATCDACICVYASCIALRLLLPVRITYTSKKS